MIHRETTQEKAAFYDKIIGSFAEFTESGIRSCTRDHGTSSLSGEEYFQQYWMSFFDQLVTEVNKVYAAYKENVDDTSRFRNDLQRIAEDGLKTLKELLVNPS